MNFLETILSAQRDLINELTGKRIEVHIDFGEYPQQIINYLALFTFFENMNRAKETKEKTDSLEEFEKIYFGIEVGNMRRYFERLMINELDWNESLLDYGCGGVWWKDAYWARLKSVYGVEVNVSGLIKLRDYFQDTTKYHLIYTPTGLTNLPSESFYQILSSSVIGYILPKQAEMHLRECWRLLKPGGKLILTRINAIRYNTQQGIKEVGQRPGSFNYSYSKKELIRLIENTCENSQIEKYAKIGFFAPKDKT